MSEKVETGSATPFTEPGAIGIPVSGFLDGFTGESVDDPRQQLRFELHDTDSDGAQIVRLLSQLVKVYARNEAVIAFARCLLRDLASNNDQQAQFSILARWVLQNVVYQADPRGIEFVISPVQMLKTWYQHGAARGDCDDHVLLLNALLEAAGIPTKVVAVALPDAAPGVVNHVLSAVNYGKGWRDFDACNKSDPFYRHTGERLES